MTLTEQGDVILTVRIDPSVHEELRKISEETERPVSVLVREGIMNVIGVYRARTKR